MVELKLIWSPRAVQDLTDICDYIARDSDQYARTFAARAIEIVETLPKQPGLGAKVPEYDPSICANGCCTTTASFIGFVHDRSKS